METPGFQRELMTWGPKDPLKLQPKLYLWGWVNVCFLETGFRAFIRFSEEFAPTSHHHPHPHPQDEELLV